MSHWQWAGQPVSYFYFYDKSASYAFSSWKTTQKLKQYNISI